MTRPGTGAFFIHLQDTRLWATQDYYKWRRRSWSCPWRDPYPPLPRLARPSTDLAVPCDLARPLSPTGTSVVHVSRPFCSLLSPPPCVSSPEALDEEPSENRRILSPQLYKLMGGMPAPRVSLPPPPPEWQWVSSQSTVREGDSPSYS